jgi:hypothetical protein
MEIPDELITTILRRDCVLFTGAGLTQDTGGKSWSGLIKELITQFKYNSPFTEDWENHPERYQEIVDDIFDKNEPQLVYEKVQEILQGAYVDNELFPMMQLPWYSVFTTNFDSALEKALRENQQEKTIIPVTSGEQYMLPGKNRELFIVYLMGCVEFPFNSNNGSMILTTGKKNQEERNRIRIYDELGNHVAKLSFIFIGYSFDDNLFIDTIKRVREKVGKETKKFYAIFKNEIRDPQKVYRLNNLGINIIYGDLREFAKKLSEKYQLSDSSNYSKIRLLVGSNIIPLEKTKIGDFLDNYRPIDYNSVSDPVSAIQFFRGKIDSFYPFKEEWHYKRKESNTLINYILHGINGQPCKIICVAGDLGAGRTIIIKSSIYELISKHNSIAIQIRKYANPFPDKDQLKEFFDEVCSQAEKLNKPKPERLIFWAEFTPDPKLVLKFRNIAKDLPFPLHFIFEEVMNEKYVEDLTRNFELIRIDITNNIAYEGEEKLINYIRKILDTNQWPVPIVPIEQIAEQEKQFFPIMYRTLNPTKQSIDDIIQQEFSAIGDDEELKELVIYCCLASSVNLEIPHTILLKVFRYKFEDPDMVYDYIYDLGNKGPQFINIIPDEQTEYLFSICHPIIAQKIIALLGRKEIDKYLEDIVKITNLTLVTDSRFIRNLLITKGENSFKFPLTYYKFPSTSEGLLKAFKILCDKQPARPILHHYAILIHILSPHDESVVPILEKALTVTREKYQMNEPKEYIYVSLARMKWDLNKDTFVKRKKDDPEILEIFALLDSAKTENDSSHPYYLQGKILMDLWENADTEKSKLPLLTEAIDILNEAYSVLQEDDFKGHIRLDSLSERIFGAVSSTNPQNALYIADEFAVRGDGTGYYYLGYISYTDRKIEECLKFLDKAMKCHYYPYSTVILKMKILLNYDNPPYHDELLKLADIFTMEQRETWESALMKGIIYTLNNAPTGVQRFFRLAFRKAPIDKKTKIIFQVKEKGKNKKFYGKVSPDLDEKEGHIYGHDIKEIKSEIFFDPRSGSNWKPLRVGMMVEFTLGFNTRGEVATDIKPYDSTQTKLVGFNRPSH